MSGLSGLLVIQSCRVVVGLLLSLKLEFDSGDIFYAGLPIPSSCERLRTQTSNGKQESEVALWRPRPEGLGAIRFNWRTLCRWKSADVPAKNILPYSIYPLAAFMTHYNSNSYTNCTNTDSLNTLCVLLSSKI